MRRLKRVINVHDMRDLARARLPRIAFDFIDGGVESEICLERNEAAFREHKIVPNYLLDVARRSSEVDLFDRTFDMPYGIAPTGGAGLYWPDADILLAKAAKGSNIPFVLSCSSTNSVEKVIAHAGENLWFQLYGTKDPSIGQRFVRRAWEAGVRTLVITVDVPITSRRERNMRNGFTRPLRRTPAIILDGLLHPSWLIDYLRGGGGMPLLENWAEFAKPGASADEVADVYASQTPSPNQSWDVVRRYREDWPGRLVVKGILSTGDALRAFEVGADGIILSNHGGRQFDIAPSSLDVLPAVRAAVGPEKVVMIDGGVRRGTDILVALCLGASFVFGGRPTLYGVGAAGLEGARKVLSILAAELFVNMGQAGLCELGRVRSDMLLAAARPGSGKLR